MCLRVHDLAVTTVVRVTPGYPHCFGRISPRVELKCQDQSILRERYSLPNKMRHAFETLWYSVKSAEESDIQAFRMAYKVGFSPRTISGTYELQEVKQF